MKDLMVVIICAVIALSLVFTVDWPTERYYDCSLAEFHPDYPQEVKQACRQMMLNSRKTYV